MTDNLRILVVDDKEKHRDSAALLVERGHKLSLADSFYGGLEQLGFEPGRYMARNLHHNKPLHEVVAPYDVVLTDLMLPLANEQHNTPLFAADQGREEHAMGYAMALAAIQTKVPRVAIVTDQNHHEGPHAASWDVFYGPERTRVPWRLNGSMLWMFDERDLDMLYVDHNLQYTDKYLLDRQVKNWPSSLEKMLESK